MDIQSNMEYVDDDFEDFFLSKNHIKFKLKNKNKEYKLCLINLKISESHYNSYLSINPFAYDFLIKKSYLVPLYWYGKRSRNAPLVKSIATPMTIIEYVENIKLDRLIWSPKHIKKTKFKEV